MNFPQKMILRTGFIITDLCYALVHVYHNHDSVRPGRSPQGGGLQNEGPHFCLHVTKLHKGWNN